ncbi:MAG: DUF3473 domain-containing protein [Deltaproteobacteria bacterium]|nr:DUF3473 domain-containing protein [Deltaproteobacteria bacterium]
MEEYFQVEAFSGIIERKDWDSYPSRIDGQVHRMLRILDGFDIRGTFFILGWLAERNPSLVKRIADAGHEIASHGFDHKMISRMTPEEFRQDVRRSKAVLEEISGGTVAGYRAPTFSIRENTSWAHEILLHEGYGYSSSVYPIWHDRYGWPEFGDHPRRIASNGTGDLWEVPLAVRSLGPVKIPFGGGGYFRSFPLFLTKAFFRDRAARGKASVFYMHPWELDTELPVVDAPFLTRTRHYLGIPKAERKLASLLPSLRFGTLAQVLEDLKGAAATPPRPGKDAA